MAALKTHPPQPPPAYSRHSLFFWSAIRRIFLLRLYGWDLPCVCKLLWFPCTLLLLLGPAGRWLTGWHSPEQFGGFHQARRPTLSQGAVYQSGKRVGKLGFLLHRELSDHFVKAFIVSLSAELSLEWNIYNIWLQAFLIPQVSASWDTMSHLQLFYLWSSYIITPVGLDMTFMMEGKAFSGTY